jgi:hypothetical protein
MLLSKEVWATHITCLNDQTEFRYAVELLRDIIKAHKDPKLDADTHWLSDHVTELLKDDGADFSYFFVFCASEVDDDLSQWRAYSDGEGGVSVALDAAALLQPNVANTPRLAPVCYREETQRWLAAAIGGQTFAFFREGLEKRRRYGVTREQWAASFLPVWRDKILEFAPMLKDKAFKAEREWRLIIRLSPTELERLRLKQRRSLISRHLPLKFGDKLPIKGVRIGPCRHPSISRASVWTALEAQKYPMADDEEDDRALVTVKRSEVPFQVP